MKKLIALLLAAIMVLSLAACASSPAADQPANDQTTADTTTEETKTEEKTEDTAASGDVEVVTYYCSIGAYLNTLQAEVANWNATTGKEKGVEIQIISDINDYSNNARALMQGGTFYDLIDAGTNSADWIVSGWVQDLNAIDNAELKELIAGYEPYIQNGIFEYTLYEKEAAAAASFLRVRTPKSLPFQGRWLGGTPRRRGCSKFAATSPSACG